MSKPLIPVALVGLALALPAAAQQACPVAADLERGIRIEFADGSTETFRTLAPGIVSVAGREADGDIYRLELAQGLHLLTWEPHVDGQPDAAATVRYDYGRPAEALPVPLPLARHKFAVMTASPAGGDLAEGQNHAYGALQTVQIGGCTYDMFEAVILYDGLDFYTEGLEYLPQLGLGYLIWNETDAQPRQPVAAVGIRAVTK